MKKILLFLLFLLGVGVSSAGFVTYNFPLTVYTVASSSYSADFEGWKAFDKSQDSLNTRHPNGPVDSSFWLRVGFNTAQKIYRMDISVPSHSAWVSQWPTLMNIQGAMTTTGSWTTLYSGNNFSWVGNTFETFLLTGLDDYYYYRLYFPTVGNPNNPVIQEVALFRQYGNGTQETGDFLPAMTSSTLSLGGDLIISGANSIITGQDSVTYNFISSTFTGVNIHRTSQENGGSRVDLYSKEHIYLSGLYVKTYTGGGANYWVLSYNSSCSPSYQFSGYIFTGWYDIGTGAQVFSGNQFEGFYTEGMRFLLANYPTIFIVMFGILTILMVVRLLYRKH